LDSIRPPLGFQELPGGIFASELRLKDSGSHTPLILAWVCRYYLTYSTVCFTL
jgi:hypothetical protein